MKSPDDIFFHGLQFQFGHFAAELIFAFCHIITEKKKRKTIMNMRNINKKYTDGMVRDISPYHSNKLKDSSREPQTLICWINVKLSLFQEHLYNLRK